MANDEQPGSDLSAVLGCGCGRVLVSLPWAGEGGSPHEGLHGGLCTPSSLPLCCGSAGSPLALGAAGDVSCPSGWSDSPGHGDQGSRDAMSLGDLGVSDYKPAFFLDWKQTGSSEERVVTSSSWHVTLRPNAVAVPCSVFGRADVVRSWVVQ